MQSCKSIKNFANHSSQNDDTKLNFFKQRKKAPLSNYL